MAEPFYRIRYRKGDFELEVQGDKEFVEQKFQELTEEEVIPQKMRKTEERIEGGTVALPESAAELLRLKGSPKRHVDISIAFSYWLFKKRGTDIFNINDIGECYNEARLKKPANTTDVMNRNQQKGYLVPAEEKKDNLKAWKITPSGEQYVEEDLR